VSIGGDRGIGDGARLGFGAGIGKSTTDTDTDPPVVFVV
jgi:hypothetical protein